MSKSKKNSQKTTVLTGSASFNQPHTAHFLPDLSLERLLTIFGGNYHYWIYAPNSYREGADAGKPDYATERYPIEPRVLVTLYADPAELVGLRFGTATRWAGFDIDAGSRLNPLVPHPKLGPDDEARRCVAATNLDRLKAVAERYGLIQPSIWQSSHKRGLWIAWAFPDTLLTREVAALLRAIALEAGFQLQSGQLEAFPNCKAYQNTTDWRKFSQYKAYRLPMQPETGSYVLNDDLEPVAADVEVLLDQLEFTARKIDIEEVQRFAALAYEEFKRQRRSRWQSKQSKREAWITELEQVISIGWTAQSQTNDLLGKIATLGRVRDGLKGQALALFIEDTAIALPGYELWCRHRHEIASRARSWASSAEAFYWHIDDPDKTRHGSYQDLYERAGTGTQADKSADYHRRRSDETLHQLTTALEALQGREDIPTLTALFEAVCAKAKELFGKAFSKRTWQRYKEQLTTLIGSLVRPIAAVFEPASPPPCDTAENAETQAESQSTPCLAESEKNRRAENAETQAESGSTPCSPIMKVFECVSDSFPVKVAALALVQLRTPWRFTGAYAHGLVEFDDNPGMGAVQRRRVNKVRSIAQGAVVEILDVFHASWWADHPQELLVYVKPQGALWFSGVAVPFRCLQPLLE